MGKGAPLIPDSWRGSTGPDIPRLARACMRPAIIGLSTARSTAARRGRLAYAELGYDGIELMVG